MNTELNPELEEPGNKNERTFNSQSYRIPSENNDSEQDPTPNIPQKNGAGRSSMEAYPTTLSKMTLGLLGYY